MLVESTFLEIVSARAIHYQGQTAIAHGSEAVTYQELDQKVNRLANLLIANNIQPGDKIGIAADRSIDMVSIMLAIMKAGAAYVPLDPNFPVERLNFMLSDSGAKLLITPRKYDAYFKTYTRKLFLEDAREQIAACSTQEPQVNLTGRHLAYILYTSGSTGKPKGVQITHHNLLNFLLSMQKEPGLHAGDVLLAVTTISFDIAGLELYLPLISGAKLIVADTDMAKDGGLLLDTVRAEKVTVMQATPYTWRMMLASGWDERLPLKVLCGGEALPKDLADKLLPRCASLWNMYGPTETTIWSTLKQIRAGDAMITVGRPIDNTQVYILDEHLKPLPMGAEGEIFIGGDGVALGYLNRPELTAEKFIDDPFLNTPGSKIYSTGDLGRALAGGEIQCLGRMDHQVKIRGYRIEAGEIEYNLMQQDNVKHAVVIVHEDDLGNQHLVAYVVKERAPATTLTKQSRNVARFKAWTEALKETLPEYMVPTDYVLLQELPLTPNGKVDRKALPKPELHGMTTDYVAPESETERIVALTWAKYLNRSRIGVQDNFFELGGHSLIAVQIMTSISKEKGKMLPIASLFKYPTVYKLAKLIDSKEEDTIWKSLVAIKPGGSKMPLYIIHGEGLNVLIFNSIANNVDAEQPVYGLQSRGLNGTDDVPDSIEAIASLYVQEILEQNPAGPYALAGYSIGGYIAVEMARQLQNMGKEVKMLAVLDTNFIKPESQLSTSKLIWDKGIRQIRKMAFIANSLAKHPAETIAYQKFMLKTRLQPLGFFKEEYDPENVPDYMQQIVDKLRYAVSRYKMTPYNGVIHVFRSKVKIYFVDDPKYLGWSKYALKGVKAHEVQGDHYNMLLPPNDQAFARVLQQCLNDSA